MTGPSPGLQGHPLPAGMAVVPSLGSSTTRPSVGGTDGMDSPTPPRPTGPGRPLPRTTGTFPPRRRGSRPTSLRSSTVRPSISGTDGTTGPSPGLQGHPLPIDVAAAPSLGSSTTRPSVGGTDGMDGPSPQRPTGPSPPRPVWPPPAPSGPAPRARCHPNETTTNDAASRRKNAVPSE